MTPGKPRPTAWDEVRPLVWLYSSYLLTSLTLGFASRFESSAYLADWFAGFCALVTLGFCVVYRRDLGEFLRLRSPRIAAVGLGLASSLGFFVVAAGVFIGLSTLGFESYSMTRDYTDQGVPTWAIFVLGSVSPAIREELAFRGVLQTRLEKVLGQRDAWLVQAGLFGAFHLSPISLVTHFGMGLMFGWLRNRFRSLYPGILLHAAWNALVIAEELFGFQ